MIPYAHLFSFFSLLVGVFFFITCTVSLFVFKHKVHMVRSEIQFIDSKIIEGKKKAAMLRADSALKHSSSSIKTMSDQFLTKARFTNVKQFVAPEDIARTKRNIA